jgi:hypothetical protein
VFGLDWPTRRTSAGFVFGPIDSGLGSFWLRFLASIIDFIERIGFVSQFFTDGARAAPFCIAARSLSQAGNGHVYPYNVNDGTMAITKVRQLAVCY